MAISTGAIRGEIDRIDAQGYLLSIPVDLAALGNVDIQTDLIVGHKFALIGKPQFVVTEVGVGSTKTITFVVDIGATATTGGTVVVTTALTATLGAVIPAAAAFSALNTGSATDTISIRGSSATAFTSGKGVILLRIQSVA